MRVTGNSSGGRDHEASVIRALERGQAARSSVVASWARSARHGLAPSRAPLERRLSGSEVSQLRERLEPVSRAARPTLERLFHAVGGFGASVILASEEGIPFERLVNSAEDRDFAAAGLSDGSDWSEAAVGTNGIGTALAEGRAVLIHREQHFLTANTALTCASAPVYDAGGEMIAVLDVSTVRRDIGEGFAALLSHSVQEAARRIEADLFFACHPQARMVLVPGLDRGLGAILAVDADELVIGATRGARLHLGLSGDLGSNPVPAADLLGVSSHSRVEDGERAVMARALARSGGNVSAAARALGISRATLHRKLGRQS
ncbi:helix-turn-helix domain-containing protein [Pseudogemmobacter faecipullorum]|uniref:Sigma-54-dependent Fis family transcriptional regulator n=1 Tax=Pseudogemmobacter faecipullorum TaxID=2755041 RepID=A0ABS8CJT7_9RHOB|nr:helix-turn-helix domain-containing protein [Pseudogemmobacter faecipullorum]MCB5409662.1 sigma-54-dependent Fis family transcriptional regulator [Pseudogemmobacter faecipullorum]